jgi:hypothetical protein
MADGCDVLREGRGVGVSSAGCHRTDQRPSARRTRRWLAYLVADKAASAADR